MESVISKELIEKYEVQDLNVLCDVYDERMAKEIHYMDFLKKTDHIPSKIFESFIENMATASVLEMPTVIINFFKDIKITYNEVLTARKAARDEINQLESENVSV